MKWFCSFLVLFFIIGSDFMAAAANSVTVPSGRFLTGTGLPVNVNIKDDNIIGIDLYLQIAGKDAGKVSAVRVEQQPAMRGWTFQNFQNYSEQKISIWTASAYPFSRGSYIAYKIFFLGFVGEISITPSFRFNEEEPGTGHKVPVVIFKRTMTPHPDPRSSHRIKRPKTANRRRYGHRPFPFPLFPYLW